MARFTAPPAGTIQRAPVSNPILSLLQSIVGVFIGILIILFLAPVVLWFAESQNTAKIFSLTKEVAPTSGAIGYIRTIDIANADSPMICYESKVEGNCLYYDYKLEELQYTAKDYCGTLRQNQQIIEKKGQKCYRDENDEEKCEQCYLVNESNWNTIKTERKFSSFSIGNFKVNYPDSSKIIGSEQYIKQIDITHKESMSYIKDEIRLLVAGNSDGKIISHGGKKKFLLVSTKDYQTTYDYLKTQDRIMGWVLRFVAFVILLVGYSMIFGPISVMSNYVRKIPLLGKLIDNAVGGVIFIISLLLAIIHFIILWVLIMIIKNIIYVALLVAIGIGVFYLYTHFKK